MEKMKKGLDVGRYDEEKGIKSKWGERRRERDAMKWEIERWWGETVCVCVCVCRGLEDWETVEEIYASCIISFPISNSTSGTSPPSLDLLHHTHTLLYTHPHRSPWLRFWWDTTAALCKWKTRHNFPKMLFFITDFPTTSLPPHDW